MTQEIIEEPRLLKVGDVIYSYQYGYLQNRHTIDRLTAKRAYSKNLQFKLPVVERGWLDEVGAGSGFGRCSYALSDPERDLEYEKKNLVHELSSVKFVLLPIEKLRKIKGIIGNQTSKN